MVEPKRQENIHPFESLSRDGEQPHQSSSAALRTAPLISVPINLMRPEPLSASPFLAINITKSPTKQSRKKGSKFSLASVAMTILQKQKSSNDFTIHPKQEIQKKQNEGWFGAQGFDFEIYKADEPPVIKRLDARSCFVFGAETSFRKAVVTFSEWIWFDAFIITIIIANSILMCFQDNNDRIYGPTYVSDREFALDSIDNVFTALFLLEAVIQIIAKGFVFHENSYLRDYWNVLDFFVVLVSLINLLPFSQGTGSFKFLRTLRVLRPLRTIKRMPKMKRLIGTLGRAMKGLIGVLFFMALIIYLFSVFGLNSFSGTQYRFCRTALEPLIERNDAGKLIKYDWPIESQFSWLCRTDDDCAHYISIFGTDQQLQPGQSPIHKCGESISFGVEVGGQLDVDGVTRNQRILWNYSNFNSVPNAMLTIFQCLTMEYWVDPLMYQYMSANNKYLTAGFFLGLVVLGSFFMMNLFLAQMISSFDQEVEYEESTQSSLTEESQESPTKDLKIGEILQQKNSLLANVQLEVLGKLNTLDESALVDEKPDELQARKRSYQNFVFRFFFKLVTHWSFNFVITVMIFLNTFCLALDTFDQKEDQELVLEYADVSFTWLFTAEAIFKLIGLGPKCYVADTYNVFDAVVVVLSVVDFIITSSLRDMGQETAVLNAFRSLRLLRIIRPLKLARRWKSLHEILGKTAKSFRAIIDFMGLLGLFMFIFSLLGMQLFGMQSYEDLGGNIAVAEDLPELMKTQVLQPISMNFNNILMSINSVYCIITGEDVGWSGIMYQNMLPISRTGRMSWGPYALYFVTTRAFGNLVLLTLFTAILCYSFSGSEDEEVKKQDDKNEKSFFEFMRNLHLEFLPFFGYRLTVAESLKMKKSPKKGRQQITVDELSPTKLFPAVDPAVDILSDSYGAKDSPFFVGAQQELRSVQSPQSSVIRSIAGLNSAQKQDHVSLPSVQHESPDERLRRNSQKLRRPIKRAATEVLPQISAVQEEVKEVAQENEIASPFKTSIKRKNSFKRQDSLHLNINKVTSEVPYHERVPDDELLEGKSLFLFGPNNTLRRFLLKVVTNLWFERIILLLILVSTLTLAFESPFDDLKSQKVKIFDQVDSFMTACFTLESLSKIITYGMLFNGPQSYLRSPWSVLDFIVVVSALIAIDANAKSLSVLKSLRTIRVLRPLRMLHRAKGLKIALTSLFKSLPQIINLQLIQFFVLVLLGIFFKTLFGGMTHYCHFEHLRAAKTLSDQQIMRGINSKWDCFNYGGEWIEPDLKYDNIMDSMVALYQVQKSIFDIQDIDMQPKRFAKPYLIILSIVVDIVVTLLFTNLFISIVYETFKGQKTMLHEHKALQKSKMDWINMQILCYEASPQVAVAISDQHSWHRNICIKITSHPYFTYFMTQNIVSNTILLAISWYGMDPETRKQTDLANTCFIWIFTTALILNLNAKRRVFFHYNWNLFDFFVVSSSQCVLLLNFLKLGDPGVKGIVVRTLRLGRMFRIIKNFKTIGVIFHTLTEAGPSIASLGSLLLLVIFMYAIIGMKLFAFTNVTSQISLNYNCNFKDFFNSFFLLMRAATGESQALMYDFSRGPSILFQCETNQIEDGLSEDSMTNACGNPVMAFLFFTSFYIIITQLFINLIIAILVDSFIGQTQSSQLPVSRDDIDVFISVWGKFDKEAFGKMQCKDIHALITELANRNSAILPKSLISSEKSKIKTSVGETMRLQEREKYIMDLGTEVFNDWSLHKDLVSVTFYELLFSMLKVRFGLNFNETKMQQEMVMSVFAMFDFKDDKLNEHQGGLSYEDRRIDILKDLKTQCDQSTKKKKVFKLHGDRMNLTLSKSYDGYIKMKHHFQQKKNLSQSAPAVDKNNLYATDKKKPEELDIIIYSEFQKQFFEKKYTTTHYIAVKKILRLYEQIKQIREQDNEFQQRRKENIKRKEQVNERLRELQLPDLLRSETMPIKRSSPKLLKEVPLEPIKASADSESVEDLNDYKQWINQVDFESVEGSYEVHSDEEEKEQVPQPEPQGLVSPGQIDHNFQH